MWKIHKQDCKLLGQSIILQLSLLLACFRKPAYAVIHQHDVTLHGTYIVKLPDLSTIDYHGIYFYNFADLYVQSLTKVLEDLGFA